MIPQPRRSVPLLPAYQQECSACHVAYPPGLLPAAPWQRPAVRSASNCAACHAGAAQGDFSEHRVRIPR